MKDTATPRSDSDYGDAGLIEDDYSLPAHYYTDPEILAREHERIFYRCWNFAGHRSQFQKSGDFVTCKVGDESIIVIRDHDDRLEAFYNVCRHRGHWLLEGSGHVDVITCPYHGWTYNTDGTLRFARKSSSVPGFDGGKFCLNPVRVEIFCGFVFVNLDPDATALAEQMPGLEQELRDYEPAIDELNLVHRKAFVIESNWKNLVDNYNENYHTPVVHPVLASNLDDSYRVVAHGMYLSHRSDARPGLAGGFEIDRASYPQHRNWWLWPNLCPMSMPGGGFRVLHIMPDGPQRTRETYDFYLPYAEPTDEQWRQINFAADGVNVEDVGVAEGIQRGQRSRSFERSYIMLDPERGAWSEHALAHFKNLVLQALEE